MRRSRSNAVSGTQPSSSAMLCRMPLTPLPPPVLRRTPNRVNRSWTASPPCSAFRRARLSSSRVGLGSKGRLELMARMWIRR